MISYFINNRISAFLLLAAFVTAGTLSMFRLPVSLLPSSEYPALSVIIEYPGITPDKIESLITRPVERILKTVSGISEMQSVSEEGKCRINITFSESTDIKIAALNVREKIELIRDTFPREVQEPVVLRYDPSDKPVIIAAVEIEGMDGAQTRDFTERRIKPSLQRIGGVSEINIAGGEMQEIHVEADRSTLEARGLSLYDLGEIIRRGNISLPCGVVESAGGNMILYLPARFRNAGDIGELMISGIENKPVYMKDVAVISFSPREKEDLSRYNGRELVTLYIHKGGGANTLSVCREAESILASFKEAKITTIYNQGDYVGSSVNNAAFSGIWGVIIVSVILMFFYRKSENVIPIALTIPASMMAVPAFLYFGGKGINVMSLSGFALGAGMVVSNGIMIMEAIKIRGGGDETVEGAVHSMKGAVISSTLTNIAVFLPMILVSRKAVSTYGDMAYTVVWALLVSLFAALVLVPSFYISIKNRKKESTLSRFIPSGVTGFFNGAGMVIREQEALLADYYRRVVDYSFCHRWRIISGISAVCFISLIIYSVLKTDSFSDQGSGEFYVYLEFPTGLSLEATDRGVSAVEDMVKGIEGVKSVSSKVEKWRGTLAVKPEPGSGKSDIEDIKSSIKEKGDLILKPYSAFTYVSEADEIASREISVHFTGDDSDMLKSIAKEGASRIKGVEGIEECLLRFRDGRPEYLLSIDRERAASGMIDHSSIAERTRNALFGPVVTKFVDSDHEIDVRVRLKGDDRSTIENLMAGVMRNERGESLLFSNLVRMSEGEGMTRIYRLNGRRSVSVTAKIGSLSFQEGEQRIKRVLEAMPIPAEYSYEFDSRLREFRKEKREMRIAIVLSVLLIYMILASQFESFKLPLLIMITIPLAAAGIAPVLFITFTPLSPPVYLGLIVLSGVVVNNGILFTDAACNFLKGKKLSGQEIERAVKDISMEKFRPVMITTITTILGMLPMLINSGEGSSLWRPFAMTITAGLFFSTILTLVVIPVLSLSFFRSGS